MCLLKPMIAPICVIFFSILFGLVYLTLQVALFGFDSGLDSSSSGIGIIPIVTFYTLASFVFYFCGASFYSL